MLVDISRDSRNYTSGPIVPVSDHSTVTAPRAFYDMPTPQQIKSSAYQMFGSIALVHIKKSLYKDCSVWSSEPGMAILRDLVNELSGSSTVTAIILCIDSPGGTVAGTQDLANAVAAANNKKPVVAFVEDMCASAAYWIASQCSKIYANNETAHIGSIGVIGVQYDESQRYAKEGVRPVVITSGEYKSIGVRGAEITEDQQSYLADIVGDCSKPFLAAVQAGRNMTDSQINAVSDGKVFLAERAQSLGLIDGIKSLDSILAEYSSEQSETQNPLTAKSKTGGTLMTGKTKIRAEEEKPKDDEEAMEEEEEETSAMEEDDEEEAESEEEETEAAASIQQLRAACVGADSDFLVAQLDKRATVAEAMKAWMIEQNKRINQTAKRPGNPPISHNKSAAAKGEKAKTAREELNAKISEVQKEYNLSRAQAASRVNKDNPELREACLAEANGVA